MKTIANYFELRCAARFKLYREANTSSIVSVQECSGRLSLVENLAVGEGQKRSDFSFLQIWSDLVRRRLEQSLVGHQNQVRSEP